MAKGRLVKAKRKCCKSNPRCKHCPVVLDRLEKAGFAERLSKRRYEVSRTLRPKVLKRARRRKIA